jgi:hypothetical protein
MSHLTNKSVINADTARLSCGEQPRTTVAYHTQEKRWQVLTSPARCTRHDAWLGDAYYFWRDETDAMHWGHTSKRNTGAFEIYQCDITSNRYLDTVFNEDHYTFWIRQLEKISTKIVIQTGEKPTVKELNDYIKDKQVWGQVDYIQYQDSPARADTSLVKPIEMAKGGTRIVPFRKRIQIAVYNPEIINNFTLKNTLRVS